LVESTFAKSLAKKARIIGMATKITGLVSFLLRFVGPPEKGEILV
jgi:hypothetical protein